MKISLRGCVQARKLVAQGTVDDHVAGVDHRAADQRRVDGGLHVDFAAEALFQGIGQLLQFGIRQRVG